MKKVIFAILALLLVSGCGTREEPNTIQIQPDPQPVVEEPVEETENSEDSTTVEITVEITSLPEEVPFELILLDGLVGDAVGYSLEIPTFSDVEAGEVIHNFYVEMVEDLKSYTEDTVHAACLERHCMANVFGRVVSATMDEGLLSVEYSYEVSYSDADEPTVSTRTDVFDMTTGEKQG